MLAAFACVVYLVTQQHLTRVRRRALSQVEAPKLRSRIGLNSAGRDRPSAGGGRNFRAGRGEVAGGAPTQGWGGRAAVWAAAKWRGAATQTRASSSRNVSCRGGGRAREVGKSWGRAENLGCTPPPSTLLGEVLGR